ncbi:hypothetical protein GCM10009584_17530 [Ornithinimicrobium humiphilum]
MRSSGCALEAADVGSTVTMWGTLGGLMTGVKQKFVVQRRKSVVSVSEWRDHDSPPPTESD